MRTVNRMFLVGHLGGDPEVRLSAAGRYVTRLRLATNRSVRDGETWTQVADWHRIVLFDRLAQVCGEQLRKGSLIAVVGEMRYNHWVDESGGKRVTAEVAARDVSFLSVRRPQPELPDSGPTLLPDSQQPEPAQPDTAAASK